MQNSSSASPAPKKSLRRRLLRYGIIGLLWVVTLVALLVVEENWRGKRAWEKYKAELEAKGEKLGWKGNIPEPVPDDQNFAQTPFLAPLFDFNLNRKPGESAWRDTNALAHTSQFADDLPSPKHEGSWREGHVTRLSEWAAAFTKGENETQAVAGSLDRTRAATEVLQQMEKYEPVLNELREASKRPFSRFKIRYEDNIQMLVPHLAQLKKIARLYQLRASAELALGQTDKALADIRMAFYMADSIKDEPILISKLVRVAVFQLALQPVWEGLGEHKWSEAQLTELQAVLSKHNFVSEAADSFRGERALMNGYMDMLRTKGDFAWPSIADPNGQSSGARAISRLTPSGFFYQNQLTMNHLYQDVSLPMLSPEKVLIHPAQDDRSVLEKELKKYALPYRIFAQILFPAFQKATMKIGYAQTAVDEATLACALERYRLAHNQFPTSLDELKPQFIDKIPHDVVNGEPLHYKRTDEKRFVLYSVGWNEKDDGGTIAFTKGSTPSIQMMGGDWGWPQYPVE